MQDITLEKIAYAWGTYKNMNVNNHVIALEMAIGLLKKKIKPNICGILSIIAAKGDRDLYDACWDIIQYISDAMGNTAFLSLWLKEKHSIPIEQLTPENMLEYRLRFIDHLIEHYKD